MRLAITDLQVSFGERRVVDLAELTVGEAEIVGLAGDSGSGKSMTTLAVLGLAHTVGARVSGSIRLDGTELTGLNYGAGATNSGYATGLGAYGTGGQLANTGQLNLGGIAQMTPDLANFPLSSLSTAYNSLLSPLQNYAGIIGSPIGGNDTQTQTTPYYSNTGANILSGLTGAVSLAKLI